jgi:uncharacterized protein (DUF849 family)
MNWEPFITCALTGSVPPGTHPDLPITPEEIAEAALEAAAAGAAVVHIHVREPDTGLTSRRPELYREVVERIRARNDEVIVNLTTGMGGDYVVGQNGAKDSPAPGTDFVGPLERMVHVEELRPELCSLDCGSLNFGEPNTLYLQPVAYVRAQAERVRELGVKPELEVFELGQLELVNAMVGDGLIEDPPFIQICLGVPFGAPATTSAMLSFVNHLPPGSVWSGFAIGRMEMPMVAQAAMLGGNLRVGLEDNLYLSRGVFASNAELVTRARELAERMGARVVGPDEVRERLGLRARSVA